MDERYRQPHHNASCRITGCDRVIQARSLCTGHYKQNLRGIVEGDMCAFPVRAPQSECAEAGCDGVSTRRGICNAHYERVRRNGNAGGPVKRRGEYWTGPRLDWSDTAKVRSVGLSGAHTRVSRLWGRASLYQCIECGAQAKDWAYDGTDPSQLLGSRDKNVDPGWYSPYPEYYMPMCRTCHKLRDNAARQNELLEYRTWKYLTGKTLADVGA